jgi:hypothetical protein
MNRYPMPALWIDSRFADRVRITPVMVAKVFRRKRAGSDDDEHMAVIDTHQNKFPVTLTRPLSELATTPEKTLEKLPALLTALASRPPLPTVAGMTEAGAANTQT